tara:strand:+ start:1210 stop:1725 length:516 start_codon:yes stop_codon:yes gene_type:complete
MLNQEQQQLLRAEQAVIKLQKREERFMYYGIYESYLANKSNIQKLDYTKLNPQQHFMFKRVLHGLNIYSKEEIRQMHSQKKKRISKVWRKGQNIINEWKQILCNKKVNNFLYVTFGEKSPFVKDLLEVPVTDVDSSYKNKCTLKDLGITYEDVILRFMHLGLLPKNFLSIK